MEINEIKIDKKAIWGSSTKFISVIIKTEPIGEEKPSVRIDKVYGEKIIEGGYVRIDELLEYDENLIGKSSVKFQDQLRYKDYEKAKNEPFDEGKDREIRERLNRIFKDMPDEFPHELFKKKNNE